MTDFEDYLAKSEQKTKRASKLLRRFVLVLIVLWGSYSLYGFTKPYFEKELPFSDQSEFSHLREMDGTDTACIEITNTGTGELTFASSTDGLIITSVGSATDSIMFTTTCADAIAIDIGDNSITFIESD